MPLFLLFLCVPLIEIALFISVGERIGLWWTLAIVVITAVAGTLALRSQGFALMRRAMRAEAMLDAPDLLSEGVLMLTAGLLLLTPGFFTDAVGFALLIPPVRQFIARQIIKRATVVVQTRGGPGAGHAGSRDPGPDPEPNPEPGPYTRAEPVGGAAGPRSARAAKPGVGPVEDAVVIQSDDPRRGRR